MYRIKLNGMIHITVTANNLSEAYVYFADKYRTFYSIEYQEYRDMPWVTVWRHGDPVP